MNGVGGAPRTVWEPTCCLIKNKPSSVTNLYVRNVSNLKASHSFYSGYRQWTLSTEIRPSSGEKKATQKQDYVQAVPSLFFMTRASRALVFRANFTNGFYFKRWKVRGEHLVGKGKRNKDDILGNFFFVKNVNEK